MPDKLIEELKGSFDCVKGIIENQVIGKSNYFEKIAFKQNEHLEDGKKV
jgi:hypothetical protein